MKEWIKAIAPAVALWACMFVVILGAWVVRSYFEAKTYSEITGKHVTTSQALWVQFRITEPYPADKTND